MDLHAASLQKVHLVDHNKLTSNQQFLSQRVETVIDHHVDESQSLINIVHKEIEVVGSACTLIAQKLLARYQLDKDLAQLLLAPILSDTFNLTLTTGRTTPKDLATAHELARIIDPKGTPKSVFDRIFKWVEEAKYDTARMSSSDLLRKDYKEWAIPGQSGNTIRMGIAAVPLSLQDWVKRDSDLSKPFQAFTKQHQLDVSYRLGGRAMSEYGESDTSCDDNVPC